MNLLAPAIILVFFAMSRVPKERKPKLRKIILITALAELLFFFLILVFMISFGR
jgi:hypothetical protein